MRSDSPSRLGAALAAFGMAAVMLIPSGVVRSQEATTTATMKNLSGPDLIRRLGEAETRIAAFRELASRSEKKPLEKLNSAEVIVCPQGTGEKPIYIVLTKFDVPETSTDHRFSGYPVEKPEELFGPPPEYPEEPIPPHGKLDKRGNLVIYAFTADGKGIMPFGGDNMLDAGIIADMNGDGIIERADMVNYGLITRAAVLEVCTAAEYPRPLLRVLYNWGPTNDWDYQFADRDGDGKIEIEFGPVIAPDVVKPKVVFAWDQAKGAYIATQGSENAHVRVLPWTDYNDHKIWQQLEQFKKQSLTFPIDPEAKGAGRTGSSIDVGGDKQEEEEPSPPPAKPYQRTSLKGMTNAQIVTYMGDGKTSWDFHREHVVPTQLPKDFWTLPAKQAAVALAEANRTEKHRRTYRLAIDDRDGREPPNACSIHYSHRSRRCYFTRDPSYFFRVDAEKAYLAYASVSGLGVVFYNIVEDLPTYDLRYAELSSKDAKHIADVIWWLRRVRTWTAFEDSSRSMTWSSADGSGALRFHAGRSVEMNAKGTVWACDAISERWKEHFGEETLVNFVDYLLQVVVPSRVGEQWTRQAPSYKRDLWSRLKISPRKAKDAKQEAQFEQQLAEQYRQQVRPLIGLYSADQSQLPHSVLRIAVDAAGDSTLSEFRAPLGKILDQLATADEPVRTGAGVTTPPETSTEGQKSLGKSNQGEETLEALIIHWNESPKSADLREDVDSFKQALSSESTREGLRSATIMAMHKLAVAGDPARLQSWAQTAVPGWQWAMARLKKIDKPRYVATLEWWLRKSKGETARQFFEAIQEVEPQKAVELATQLPPDQRTDLTVSAYSVLEKANAVSETNRRVDALIAVTLDRSAGWQQRTQAIELLVPDESPLKYPDRKIDEAFLRLFNRDLGDSVINFTLASACHALAIRGRTEYSDRMLQRFNDQKEGEAYNRMRVSLVQLAQRGTEEQRAKLSDVLVASLKQTDHNPSGTILCIYALDRREWKDDLERMATSGPEDYDLRGANKDKQSIYRSHEARKIAAIWNEDDPLTRAKLLIAFGLHASWYSGEDRVVPDTVRKQLREVAGDLSAEQAKQVLGFVKYCEKKLDNRSNGSTELGDSARKIFAAIPVAPKVGP